jgi:hypothetical protein
VSATNEGKGVRDTHSTSYKKQLEKNKVSDAIETPVQKIDMAKIETVLNSAYKATELANKLLASTSNQSQNRPKPR